MSEIINGISEFMKSNWQITLIGIGAIMLIGSVFNINFIVDRQGQPYGTSFLGDKSFRFFVSLASLVLIAYGVMSLLNVELF